MNAKNPSQHNTIQKTLTIITVALLLTLSIFTFVNADTTEPQAITQDPFYSFTFNLEPGTLPIVPTYYANTSQDINFSFTITGASANSMATLDIISEQGANIWSGNAYDAESIWGSVTLPPGNNSFVVENTGPDALEFTLLLFNIPEVQPGSPHTWAGHANPQGMNSSINLNFETSGLYTFDFSVSNGDRYEFYLDSTNDDAEIWQTVTSDGPVSLYVDAGVQTLEIFQDTSATDVIDWQVDISATGQAVNSLPYTKANQAVQKEQLPIHLSEATQVNMVITATGTANDFLNVSVAGATPQLHEANDSNFMVYAGETSWVTFDLPAGTSSIEMSTTGDPMDYDLEVAIIPSVDFTYSGFADSQGQNSKIRLAFDTAGLYDFEFGDNNGRYQFLLDVDDDKLIQKTIEGVSHTTYYVPAGTHELIIDQDTTQGANWNISVSLNTAGDDSLPYTQSGGDIGGSANDFTEEWLPISLNAATTVNMAIKANGDMSDSFAVEVYQSGSSSPDYTLSQVLGTEEQWANFDLSAGLNRLRIVSSDTGDPLTYDLELTAMPADGNLSWSGNVLDSGLNASVIVNFPADGLYQFNIESSTGFANLVLDNSMTTSALNILASPPDLGNNYAIEVTAGQHEIFVMQDNTYANTTWSATVAPASASSQFFEFTGTLEPGESVTPIYPGNLDFNFSLTVTGNTALDITDGNSATVWSGTAIAGETIWGNGTLHGNNTFMITNTSGSSADVTLTLYHIPDAGYSWDGFANSLGLNSHIQVNFPTDGLYTFNLNADSGQFQFLLDSDYIQKTVISSNTVAYFVPAGIHNLTIVQDTNTADTDWDVTISDVGADHDTLPYAKTGGPIGGAGNDADAEWLPIHLSGAAQVNLEATINGNTADSVTINVVDGSSAIIETLTVYGGETTWTTLDLPAGTNRITVDASGNSASADYDITLTQIPSAASYSWAGSTLNVGANSHIRVNFPSSGVYTFDQNLSSGNGRFQFLINDNFVQKTVETSDTSTFYIPAGIHDLTITQDRTLGANWRVAISGPTASIDTLPLQKVGGQIGGSGNDFTEEWLPAYVGSDTPVNAVITVSGDSADSLMIEVWDTTTKTHTIDSVYGTESIWATFTLPTDARLNVIANESNSSEIDYKIEIIDIPAPPFTWEGTSLNTNTLNSKLNMMMQAGGTYNIQGNFSEGFASLIIDPPLTAALNNATPQAVNADIEFDLELDAGLHTFLVWQNPSFPSSTWAYTVTLVSAYAPTVTDVSPGTVAVGQQTLITVTGTNFLDGAQVTLLGSTNYTLTTTYVSASGTQLTAVVPANVDIDLYDVKVTNPDAQSATLADSLAVVEYHIFLPFIIKE
ncbi:MAG: hypothetical protein CSB13_11610 [Chloroflexi bacterium]|nr:MAG: hypothetical protein CSB13_11610 [Chloroflexota bacterium]